MGSVVKIISGPFFRPFYTILGKSDGFPCRTLVSRDLKRRFAGDRLRTGPDCSVSVQFEAGPVTTPAVLGISQIIMESGGRVTNDSKALLRELKYAPKEHKRNIQLATSFSDLRYSVRGRHPCSISGTMDRQGAGQPRNRKPPRRGWGEAGE